MGRRARTVDEHGGSQQTLLTQEGQKGKEQETQKTSASRRLEITTQKTRGMGVVNYSRRTTVKIFSLYLRH